VQNRGSHPRLTPCRRRSRRRARSGGSARASAPR